MRAGAAAALGAASLAVTACSSSGSTGTPALPPPPLSSSSSPAATSTAPTPASTSAAPTSAAPSSSVAPTSAPATSGQPSPSRSAAPAGSDRCHTSQLTFRLGESDAGAGMRLQVVVLTNTSQQTCTVRGYPGLRLVDGSRKFLPTIVTRGGGNTSDPGPSTVTLKPNGVASFALSFAACVNGPDECSSSTYLEVTPPDETDYVFNKATVEAFKGQLTVTALVAGGSGPA